MATEPSRKELRRRAALREKERRSRVTENANIERTADVKWGSASLLPNETRSNILRVGATPQDSRSGDAVEILTREIRWPASKFRSSTRLFLQHNPDAASSALDETSLQDAMPVRCFDYKFADSDEVDEIQEILNLGASSLRVIGFDTHHYFLIGPNPDQTNDPLLYHVDHAGTDEPPYHPNDVTIGWLLAVLAFA